MQKKIFILRKNAEVQNHSFKIIFKKIVGKKQNYKMMLQSYKGRLFKNNSTQCFIRCKNINIRNTIKLNVENLFKKRRTEFFMLLSD